MRNHFVRPQMPGSARGLLPLIMAAMNVGKGIVGAVQANQQEQRNKGYIGANARIASRQLEKRQQDVSQNTAESLIARGLSGGGQESSAIRSAMGINTDTGNVTGAPRATDPRTLGGQITSDVGKEFDTEWSDLGQQTKQAYGENKASALNAQIGSLVDGASSAASSYSAAKDLAATPQSGSPIQNAMQIPGAFGVDAVDPLGPGSAWHPSNGGKAVIGAGQPNYDFG